MRYPVLPLRDIVLFPHVAMPLLVGRSRSLSAVSAAAEQQRDLLLVTQQSADDQVPAASELHRVGVLATVRQVSRLPNGSTRVLVDAHTRVRVARFTVPRDVGNGDAGSVAPVLATASAFPLDLAGSANEESVVRLRRASTLFEEYATTHRRVSPEVVGLLQSLDDPARLAFAIAAHLQVPVHVRQELLACDTLVELESMLTALLSHELELLRLERRIDDQVRSGLFQNQREFFLQEQLKAIHRELGNDDSSDLDELQQQLDALGLPASVQERATKELRRLRKLSPMSPEAAVSRSWLDWIAALPWQARSEDRIDLRVARAVLEADHHGLADVKERILDHMAVLARVGTVRGPILCLVGPPGVGKTSLARSIARAMERQFVRVSLGGVRDEAEIRGHRRTYVGALPGRIIQSMRRAKVVNPVLLLDELDKLGSDWRGDPSSALLEVLDPEQHRAFADHYLEVDYDLSQVLFITTANSLPGIPDALRDRLEVVRLPGYLEPEKLAIATRYLLPRQLEAHGLGPADVVLGEEALLAVIRGWTREAGVRDLERRLARLVRKVTRALADEPAAATERPKTKAGAAGKAGRSRRKRKVALPLTITADALTTYLGVAPYDVTVASTEDRVGVANGLAYTSVGGEVLEIEVSVIPGRGRLQLTGTLGNVMKESASAALTWVRSRLELLDVPPDFLQHHDLHVHVPAGATPKDGPSAGIAIAVAMASALSGRPVRGDLAMTGEVTLRGRVLPIGGLREKGVAAHQQHMAHVIIPKANARELTELPGEAREGVEWHPMAAMDDVLALALRPAAESLPRRRKSSSTKQQASAAPETSPRKRRSSSHRGSARGEKSRG